MHARHLTPLALIAVLALAAGLRFYRIDAQSLWNDEGNSARIAERSATLIVEGAAGDIHPPLYYLALQVWRDLFGSSEAALRGLSAVLGVVTVLFTYRLGRRLFEARVGLIAAFLAAVNPFLVYYSQEARMYMLLAAIGVVATYLLVRLIDFWSLRPRIHIPHRRYYVLYVAAMAAGLYTHYAFPFVFVAHFAIVLAWSLYRPDRALARIGNWLSLAIAAALLFAPWLPTAIRQIAGWPSQAAAADAGSALLNAYRTYLLGESIALDEALIALIVAGFFLAMSLWTPDAFDEPEPDWDTTAPRALRAGSVAIYLLLPLALVFVLGLFKDAYLKFLLVGSPAFCLLLARGIDNGWQIARGALRPEGVPPELRGPHHWAFGWLAVVIGLVAFVLVPTAASLNNMYFDPQYARDDYRGMAETIHSAWRDGDAVVLHAANQWEVFTYYFADGPHVFPIVKQRPLDPARAERELTDIFAGHRRLWVVYWAETEPDPAHWVETWLDANAYKAAEQPFGDVRLVTYAVPVAVADTPDQRRSIRLGDRIWLDGFSLLTPAVAPGDIVQVALFWRSEKAIQQRYKVFVHITNTDGALVAQTDREPGGDRVPTTIWVPQQPVVDRYGVALPQAVAEGSYQISVGMYDLDGTRLRISEDGVEKGDALPLGEVAVNDR
jgi:4-amino-4-deoxy-L-arabinose transferase-like glycosyltransferase